MKDYLSIKEFSELTGIEGSTLRYWDDIGLFAPAKRNEYNGYRYYTPSQIIQVNFILVLSSLSIPLKTISDIEKRRTPESILDLIETQERTLDSTVRQLNERLAILHTRRWMIKYGLLVEKIQTDGIVVMNLGETRFIRGKRNEFQAGETFHRTFVEFCQSAKDRRINLRFPICGMHDNWQEYQNTPSQPNYYCSIDPDGNEVRKSGDCLIGFVRGYYGELGDLPKRMDEYIKKNNIKVTGDVFAIYLHDEICIKNPSEYLTIVVVAVEK